MVSPNSKKVLNSELERLRARKRELEKHVETLKLQIDGFKDQLNLIQIDINNIKIDTGAQ